MMTLRNLWAQEPVAIVNSVRLCALAGMTFGLHLTPTQLLASMAALESVLTLFTRASVHTTAAVNQQLADVAALSQRVGV